LFSGHHANIATWKQKEALRRTYQRRPDLLENYEFTADERKLLKEVEQEERENNL
jgi:tRNA (guanine37-N1)-methyltransferase